MRGLLLLALSAGALLASAQPHPLPVRPKVVHHLVYEREAARPAIVLESGQALPSMPALPVFAPVFIDYIEPEARKPKWPRDLVQPEQEYDATPLLAPPDCIGHA